MDALTGNPSPSQHSRLPCSASERQSSSFFSPDSTLPREITENRRLVTDDPELAADLTLDRGQYRMSVKVPYDGGSPVHVRELAKAIPIDEEFKRVYFYKISFLPIDEEFEGQPLARLTAVFHVVDNPLPLVPIAWAAVAAIASGGSWLLIDKVEEFSTESLTGAFLTTAGAIAGLLILWKTFEK